MEYNAILHHASYHPMWADRITGKIEGDKKRRFRDGEWVTTSRVLSIEGDIVKTLNSVYKLVWAEGKKP